MWLPEVPVVDLRKLENMGTHITIAEFMIISVLSVFIYAAGKAAYDTWLK